MPLVSLASLMALVAPSSVLALTSVALIPDTFADPDTLTRRERLGEPAVTAALLRAYRALPPVTPPEGAPLEAVWRFALGDPQEGLNPPLERMPALSETVTLPQRRLHPDTPFWYAAEVAFPRPSVLRVAADDGAQVYVDGRRVPLQGEVFAVPASPNPVRLVIRVVNKAMYGGLEGVWVVPQDEYDRWRAVAARRARLDAVVRKVRLLYAPTRSQVAAAERAVREEGEFGLAAAGRGEFGLAAAGRALAGLPLVVAGPYLQEAAGDRMTVVWETDTPCAASLLWSREGGAPQAARAVSESGGAGGNGDSGTLHRVTLTGLEPGAAYRYRLRSGKVTGPEHTFRTLPSQGPFAFAVWGDAHVNEGSGGNNEVFRQNVHLMRRLPIAFAVGAGDQVEQAHRIGPWRNLFDALAPLAPETPLMLVGGNHEYDGCFEDLRPVYFERYARASPRPQYFAWSAGDARFVALDPNEHFPTGIPAGSAQYRWLMQELESEAWKRAKWRFLFVHQPPFSQGWAEYHGDLPIRALLEPLIEKYRIDFVISGHTHDYERWTRTYGAQTVHFLILGGAGGGLEDPPMSDEPVMDRVIRRHHVGLFRVEGSRVRFECLATDGRVLDRLEAAR